MTLIISITMNHAPSVIRFTTGLFSIERDPIMNICTGEIANHVKQTLPQLVMVMEFVAIFARNFRWHTIWRLPPKNSRTDANGDCVCDDGYAGGVAGTCEKIPGYDFENLESVCNGHGEAFVTYKQKTSAIYSIFDKLVCKCDTNFLPTLSSSESACSTNGTDNTCVYGFFKDSNNICQPCPGGGFCKAVMQSGGVHVWIPEYAHALSHTIKIVAAILVQTVKVVQWTLQRKIKKYKET